ncbi:type II toxin-antitoxin system VapC family toxin [Methylocaldum sp.]|uniref:type II toxin-antitoxin system VapC family toxin n=1 Tax=Methylocaldum sp. TaxID=1969727 RepID=UPI002D495D86|nr:type II toxin-antitoxin system VapC family toxin [Methylocaldum sp.]HYE37302.1 type II toxin-antitoxin system VapC family toxin [Methylocaldum sp.]
MNWLLDTCVLSEYVKKQPAPEVIAWLDEQDEQGLFISVVTLGEIEKGIVKLRQSDPDRSQKLTAWLGKVERRFAERTLPLDAATLRAWAQISGGAELAGHRLPVLDALLTAAAQCHGLTVVTRNVQDFSLFPHVFNPWVL